MGRTAYLLIPDVHLGNILSPNRINYRNEMLDVQIKLTRIAVDYKKAGYDVVALFLGDIFHSSYRDVTSALVDKEFITMWNDKIGKIYSVVGNHELTYYKANPFYTAIAEMQSEKIKAITNKVWTPLGATTTINVVDELIDGEVCFLFNHYGTNISAPKDGLINIGLFHQDLIDPQIKREMERSDRRLSFVKETELENSAILRGYQYCYFGHLHTVYGAWKAGETYLVYLASLGRTNEGEVRNDFLERNIPAVLVEDGQLKGIKDNFIQLLPREECIREDVLEKMREHSVKQKEKKELRNYTPIKDDPMGSLKVTFLDNAIISRILSDLEFDSVDSYYKDLHRRMENIL